MEYLKDAQNSILLALDGVLVDDPLCADRMDEAFKEALGYVLVVKGTDLVLGTFG